MENYKLYMILLGCKPNGRNIEQHDIFFGIAPTLKELIPEIKNFWKDSGSIHIDGFKTITNVDGYKISIVSKSEVKQCSNKLFFINLGGYKAGEFEEFHYKTLIVSPEKNDAIKTAKQSTFFKHTGFGNKATAHIDDKYGIDIDDIYTIEDILSSETKSKFAVQISDNIMQNLPEDELHLGYFKLSDF
jgi:Domain of Unknown Function (DUF1543)